MVASMARPLFLHQERRGAIVDARPKQETCLSHLSFEIEGMHRVVGVRV